LLTWALATTDSRDILPRPNHPSVAQQPRGSPLARDLTLVAQSLNGLGSVRPTN
jgi:hypothetical protein